MNASNLSVGQDLLSWPSPAHRALAEAIAQDDPRAAHAALAQGVDAAGVVPERIRDDVPPRGLAHWSGLGWLAMAVLADRIHCAQALVDAGASVMQPDDEGEPIALWPFQRQRADWIAWLDQNLPSWSASFPIGPQGYGPLAHALAGRGPDHDQVVNRVLARPGEWTEPGQQAVWVALVTRCTVGDMPRLMAVGLHWDEVSPACKEAMLEAALLNHQVREESAATWLEFLAEDGVPLTTAFAHLHPAVRADYAQRLVAHHSSAMGLPPSALDPLSPAPRRPAP